MSETEYEELSKLVDEYLEFRKPLDDLIEEFEYVKRFTISASPIIHNKVDIFATIKLARETWKSLLELRKSECEKIIKEK